MVRNVTLTIDHKSVTVPENTTILEAARSVNINIPTLCYLKDINEIGACRICCVEVEGMERLVPACDNVVADGMEVFTNSPMAREARRANLRLILSEHDTSCTSCSRSGNCTLQSLANDFNMRGEHYPTKLRREAVDYSTPLIRENDKCVKCMRCIQICENVQTVKIWDLLGTGSRATVDASRNRRIQDTECTYCGQCITHCPTAALRERDDTGIVFDAIDDPNTVTVVQVAPAVRAAWAEQFNLSPEFATPKRMAAALRELGFNYVFDTDFAADLTIMEEGSEFLERFTHKKDYRWPMFTSCCPGWMRFLKSQYPERTEELSTAKSPQQMFGAIAKTYFAEKIGIDPKRLFVVSIMPCVAKKSECALPTMRGEDGIPDVDVSITTRELDIMLRANHISPVHLPEEEFDSPLGSGTGAAVVFGATGGVMDAALRSAYYLVYLIHEFICYIHRLILKLSICELRKLFAIPENYHDLFLQMEYYILYDNRHVILQAAYLIQLVAVITRIQNLHEFVDHIDNGCLIRLVAQIRLVDGSVIAEIIQYPLHDSLNSLFI